MPLTPPIAEQLAEELQRVSYYGVGRAMDSLPESDIPNLATIARRLAPDPRDRLRVSIAVAVREAVLLLDPRRHVLAAGVLLWLDLECPDFEEDRSRKRKPLYERHPEVAALLGIAISSYERRKKWRLLYERIAANLMTLVERADAAEAEESSSVLAAESVRTSNTEALDSLALLPESAADLYFAALSSLFVADFHNQCANDVRLRVPRLFDWANVAEHLFFCVCRFIETHMDAYHSPLLLESELSPARPRLDQLLELIMSTGPPLRLGHYMEIFFIAGELGHGSRNVAFPGLRAAFDEACRMHGYNDGQYRGGRVYDEVWMPWYQTQFAAPDSPWPPRADQAIPADKLTPDNIERLAAIGESYLEAVTAHIDLGRPVLTQARQRAQRLLASVYDVDDWRPLGVGGSLRNRIDYFLDKANQPLACQKRYNMLQM